MSTSGFRRPIEILSVGKGGEDARRTRETANHLNWGGVFRPMTVALPLDDRVY